MSLGYLFSIIFVYGFIGMVYFSYLLRGISNLYYDLSIFTSFCYGFTYTLAF
jgi:hypothetical protein